MTEPAAKARSFVDIVRRAIAGEVTVRTWWGCPGLSGEEFRRWFGARLAARINRGDRRPCRRLSPDYQAALARDARRVREIMARRIIHRQFETDIVNARFGHLLTRED
jgi:hypothetical protein